MRFHTRDLILKHNRGKYALSVVEILYGRVNGYRIVVKSHGFITVQPSRSAFL